MIGWNVEIRIDPNKKQNTMQNPVKYKINTTLQVNHCPSDMIHKSELNCSPHIIALMFELQNSHITERKNN